MKIINCFINLLAIAALLLTQTSCEEAYNEPDDCNIIYITNEITANTTFNTGNVYIIDINGDWVIEAELVIEPGVVVKSLKAYQRWIVRNAGKVIANGTSESPIVFTSQYDNEHGCDNSGDGTAPQKQDWGQFSFIEVGGCILNYCHFYYGGGSLRSTVEIDNSTVDITNCVFAYNYGGDHYGYKGVLNLNKANLDCVVTNNVFYGNDVPVSADANFSFDDSNVFHNPDDISETNQMNGIFTDSYTIDGHVSWLETEVAFVVANGSALRIEDLATLTLGADVVIKVVEGSQIDLKDDATKIINYNGAGVFFTSIFDDSLKGDTNGDGNQTSPSVGDWDGIIIDHGPLEYASWPNILYDK
jgi:hypothetical protein